MTMKMTAKLRREFERDYEWFGVNLPPTLKTQRAVLARFRGDVEAMLCYEAADWATVPPHVRLDINARLSGYQEVCAVTDRERYWPNLDDAEWAVLSELAENLADLCFGRRTISGPSNTLTGAATDMQPRGYITGSN